MVKYPIGQQDFKGIREGGYAYVDKTDYIRLLLNNKYYFLSRPRRFGKSLFLSTLYYFFSGERDLFRGLSIDSWADWQWNKHPVIRISFISGAFYEENGLKERLDSIIRETAQSYGVSIEGGSPGEKFRSLILALHRQYGEKVVVLVDEYDKPLLDVMDREEILSANRDLLSSFYSVIKDSDEYLLMAFLTGVTRFGHLNIFSGLNNLKDISLSAEYSAICGITEKEVNHNFQEGIENLAEKMQVTFSEAVDLLREYYDGYHFSDELIDVYNPYSLITALSEGKVKDIWPYTGNSNYLLQQLKKEEFDLFDLEGTEASSHILLGTNPDYTDPVTLLYQSGYLTIKGLGRKADRYILGLPNHEVSSALYEAIIPFYTGHSRPLPEKDYSKVEEWMQQGNAEAFLLWLKEFFAKVTYDVKLLPLSDRMRQESDFQFVVYCILALSCGLNNVRLEDTISNGRIDISVETRKFIYIFEFKLGEDASEAINQIRSKDYAAKWASDSRTIKFIGVAFSPETRGVFDYAIDLP